jgi:hypothetical protein
VDFLFDQACKDAYDELKRHVTSALIIRPYHPTTKLGRICMLSPMFPACWTEHIAITIQLKRNFLQWCLLLKNSGHIYLVQKSLFLLTMQL